MNSGLIANYLIKYKTIIFTPVSILKQINGKKVQKITQKS